LLLTLRPTPVTPVSDEADKDENSGAHEHEPGTVRRRVEEHELMATPGAHTYMVAARCRP
jgi:hypothetical protein